MIVTLSEFAGIWLGTIVPFLVLAFCSWRSVRSAVRRSPETALAVARRITIHARVVTVVAALAVVIGIGGVALTLTGARGNVDDVPLVVFSLTIVAGFLIGLAQGPSFRLAGMISNLVDTNQENLELSIDRGVGYVERTACGAAIGALLIVSVTILILLPITVLFLLFGVPALVWQRRRVRESQLLWSLALAARHGRNFSDEIRQHARAWSGFHACRLRELAVYLESGRDLGFALQMVPDVLPSYCVSAIRAAEETSTLSETLTEVAKEHVRRMQNRFQMGSPAGLVFHMVGYLSACFMVVTFLCYYIVPKIQAIFAGFGTELPQLTEQFINFSDIFVNYFYIFMWIPVPFFTIALLDQRGWQTLKMRMFAWFYPEFDAAGVLRHLAHTIERDRPLSQGILSLANSHYRPTVQEAMARIYVDAESGNDPWAQLHRRRFLNRRDLAVIQTAQQVGNLPWALREIAKLAERRNLYRLDMLMQFLRPAAIVSLGVIVAFVCIAMFLPLTKLLNDLS